MKISDNELKVMDIIWDENNLDENDEITAKEVSDLLIERYGWQKATNYVYLNRLLKKEAITRRYPKYTIKALLKKDDVVNDAVNQIIDKTYDGSAVRFFKAFLTDQRLSKKELDEIKSIVDSFQKDK